MRRIFADFEIVVMEKDHEAPGVFLKARKPENHVPIDLSDIALYSMILNRRTRSIPSIRDVSLTKRLMLKFLLSKAKWLFPEALLNPIERYYLQ